MRVINIEVKNCSSCPFNHYDAYYNTHIDSGYDCKHPNGDFRIVTDGQLGYHNYNKISIEEYFKKNFPDKCPLPLVPSTLEQKEQKEQNNVKIM